MAVLPAFYISTFSGIGALDIAVRRVLPRSQCLLYVEREIPAVATLAARMEAGDLDAAPVWGDVRTVPTDHLRGRVSLVVGGFPCQDISSAGKRTGILGSRSGLFFDLVRLVRDVGAEYVFLENVAALTVRGLDTVLGTLAEIGFAAEWGCLRASDAGAPHGRDRWWCLAWNTAAFGVGQADSERGQLGIVNGPRQVAQALPGAGSTALADSEGIGLRPRWAESTGQSREAGSAGQSCSVADAECTERWPHNESTGQRFTSSSRSRSLGEPLGDSGSPELRQAADGPVPSGLHRRAGAPMESARGVFHASCSGLESRGIRLHADRPSGEMADATCECRAQQPFIDDARRPLGSTEHRAGCRVVDGSASKGVRVAGGTDAGRLAHLRVPYPPGPGDRDRWAAYLRAYPNLAPAIESAVRRGADGPSTRVDRLRGLGNAVVPDQAEWALRLLWFRAFGEWP